MKVVTVPFSTLKMGNSKRTLPRKGGESAQKM